MFRAAVFAKLSVFRGYFGLYKLTLVLLKARCGEGSGEIGGGIGGNFLLLFEVKKLWRS